MTPVKETTKTVYEVVHCLSSSEGTAQFNTEIEAIRFACFCDLAPFFPDSVLELLKNNPESWQALASIFNRLVGTL